MAKKTTNYTINYKILEQMTAEEVKTLLKGFVYLEEELTNGQIIKAVLALILAKKKLEG